jgi:hypothetical protein
MYDRPTLSELLDAVRIHLDHSVVEAVQEDRKLYFQTLVAINALRIIEREMHAGFGPLQAEWGRLNFLQKVEKSLPTHPDEARAALAERNRKLCEEIVAGRYDYAPQRAALFEHLLMTTHEQLEIANPRFLETLAIEDEKRARTRS